MNEAKYIGEIDNHFWKEYFSVYDTLNTIIPYQQLKEIVNEKLNKYTHLPASIIDYGCGSGNISKKLKDNGFQVTAVDQNENALNIARTKNAANNYVQKDITEEITDNKETYDGAVLINVMYSISQKNRMQVCKNLYSLLKPDGIVVVVNPKKNFSSLLFATNSFSEHIKKEKLKAFRTIITKARDYYKLLQYNIRIESNRNKFIDPVEYSIFTEAGFKQLESLPVYLNQSLLYVFKKTNDN